MDLLRSNRPPYGNFKPIGKLLGGVPRVKLNANPHFLRYGVILLAVSLFTRRCDAGSIFGVCFIVVITHVIISSKHRRSGRNILDRRHAADTAGICLYSGFIRL